MKVDCLIVVARALQSENLGHEHSKRARIIDGDILHVAADTTLASFARIANRLSCIEDGLHKAKMGLPLQTFRIWKDHPPAALFVTHVVQSPEPLLALQRVHLQQIASVRDESDALTACCSMSKEADCQALATRGKLLHRDGIRHK